MSAACLSLANKKARLSGRASLFWLEGRAYATHS